MQENATAVYLLKIKWPLRPRRNKTLSSELHGVQVSDARLFFEKNVLTMQSSAETLEILQGLLGQGVGAPWGRRPMRPAVLLDRGPTTYG